MTPLRAFFRTHRRLAALLLALTLCVKVLMPAGFMLGQTATTLTAEICTDASGGKVIQQIAIPHSGKQDDHAKAADACPYAGLAMPGLAGADAALLIAALAFILALGFAPARTAPPRRTFHVRPPLRGPPALA